MSVIENVDNYTQCYKEISDFLIGLEVGAKLENSEENIRIQKAENENYWIRILLTRTARRWDSYILDSYTSFTVYMHKYKYQVVVKANIKWSSSNDERRFITARLTEILNEKGFRSIKYDMEYTSGSYYTPYSSFKVVVDDKGIDGIFQIYELVEEFNNKLYKQWIENRKF